MWETESLCHTPYFLEEEWDPGKAINICIHFGLKGAGLDWTRKPVLSVPLQG